MLSPRILRYDDPLAVELTAVLKQGDADRLSRLLVRALAAYGADLDVPAVGMWHREAPVHWAASSDDVELIDALRDAGADIERSGSWINGGSQS